MSRTSFKVQRIVASVLLIAAFVVMASVFSPRRSTAQHENDNEAISATTRSTDAHEGLRSLGTLHDVRYIVHMYATDAGPRFTIVERQSSRELGTLLSSEQVQRAFPELNLPQLDFSVPTHGESWQPPSLMLAEPRDVDLHP